MMNDQAKVARLLFYITPELTKNTRIFNLRSKFMQCYVLLIKKYINFKRIHSALQTIKTLLLKRIYASWLACLGLANYNTHHLFIV